MRENPKDRLDSIKYLLKSKRTNQALTEIIKYLDDYPDDVYGKFQYGLILKSQNDFDRAVDIFYGLYDDDAPNKYTALYEMGRIKELMGDHDYAKFYFKKVLEESPYGEVFSAIELAKIEKRQGNIKEAEKVLSTSLNSVQNQGNNYLLLELAKIKLLAKEKKEAKSLIYKIKKTKNEKFDRKVMQFKGKLEVTLHNYQEALNFFDSSLGNKKDDVYWSSILEIARVYYKIGRLEEAKSLCMRIKENKNLFLGDVDLLLGNIYEEQEDITKAEEYYLKSLKQKVCFTEKEALFNLGNIEIKKGNIDKAKEYFTEVTKTEQLFKAPAYFQLLFLSLREENYQECYSIIKQLQTLELNTDMKKTIAKTKLYLDLKSNKKINLEKSYTYSEQQIINYDEDKALEFIMNDSKNTDIYFEEGIDVYNLFYNIKDKLTKARLVINNLMDTYLIKYPNIGYHQNEIVNELKVICLPNTKKIITMYPNYRAKELTRSEENSDEERTSNKKKVKRLSQIEKFNARYETKK